jgi:hypothetical protein
MVYVTHATADTPTPHRVDMFSVNVPSYTGLRAVRLTKVRT